MDKPEKMDLRSMGVADDKRRQLAQLFPEVVTETRTDDGKLVHAVDFEKLKGVLGEFSEILENQRERYGMTWPGKNECLKIIQQPSVGRRSFKSLIPEAEIEYPKPVDLLKRCIYFGTNNKDIVLDFFAGSCTTAQAVLELNSEHNEQRRFICVQLPEPFDQEIQASGSKLRTIADLGKLRVNRVIGNLLSHSQKGSDTAPLQDFGFRVFKLDRSNFRLWDGEGIVDGGGLMVEGMSKEQIKHQTSQITHQLELHEQHIDSNATQEDILYELLLKAGFLLTTKVAKVEMAGKEIFSIADGALLICLQDEITKELIKAMADANPLQVICLDSGFKNNDQLKANAVQTFKARNKSAETATVFRTV